MAKINLELIAKFDKAISAVESFSKFTEKKLNGINFNTSVSAIKDGFDLIKNSAEAAFNVVEGFASSVIEESIQAEEAQIKLANALKLSGQFSEKSVKQFNDLASELQELTTFSDEQVLSAVALAKQYNLTNKEAEKVVRTSVDLAAATGEDLDSAVRSVAQSFNGFVDKGLAKSVPELKKLSKEALISGDAIDVLNKRFGGSAVALGDTFSGALTKAGNSFSDLLETIGGLITQNPVFIESIKIIQDTFKNLNKEVSDNSGVISTFLVDGFKSFVALVPTIIKAFQAIDTVISNIILSFVTLGRSFGAIGAAIVEATKGNFAEIAEINRAVTEDNRKTFEDNSKRIAGFYDPLIKAAETASGRIQKIDLDAANKKIKTVKERNDKEILEDRRKNAQSIQDAKDAAQKAREEIEKITKDPLAFQIEKFVQVKLQGQENLLSDSQKQGIALAAGFVSTVLKGADGAKKAISSAIGAAANAIIPGIGGVVSEIVSVLAEGPEKVKEMVQGFVRAIPGIVENIILSIPALIEALVDEIPRVIDAFIDKLPTIIEKLAESMPRVATALALQSPKIAIAFATSFVQNIPEIVESFAKEFLKIPERFLDELLKNIPGGKQVGGAVGDAGGFVGDIFGGIGDFFGGLFAEGGRVPDIAKFEGDKFPARLNAGEQVLSKDLSSQLETFLAGESGGQNLTVNIRLGEQQLAQAILNLNRRGFRTS